MGKGSKGKARERQTVDSDLFEIDAAGDEALRSRILSSTWDAPAAAHPRRGSGKPLKSLEILAQRSKVPAQKSKAQPGIMVQDLKEREKRARITPELKRRLKGLVQHANSNERSKGNQALPDAVAGSGTYDVWSNEHNASASTSRIEIHEDIKEFVTKAPIKLPKTLHAHSLLSADTAPVPISLPHPGQSYNPTLQDHQALLQQEHEKAAKEEAAFKADVESKELIMSSRVNTMGIDSYDNGYADEVGSGDDEAEAINEDEGVLIQRRRLRRKTDKAKARSRLNKALEAQTRAQVRLTKAQRQAIGTLPSILNSLNESSSISLSELHKRKTALATRLTADGLVGMRSGPARVPQAKQPFLLSEELPENLRHLKPDGSLWDDWLNSSRRRGKIQMERRAYDRMTKLKGRGLKAVEKATWRNFDRTD